MISLILDTNILHQEGFSSGNMQLLRRLVEASYVEVFVPEISKKEFLTRRVIEAKEKLKDAQNSLSSVTKKLSKNSEVQTKTSKVQTYIREIESLVDEDIYGGFSKWEDELSVTILPFRPEVMTDVMDEYFLGTGVYRKPKSRDDIPDAIINKSIEELISERLEVTVAVKDAVFKKHLSRDHRIKLVDSIEEFLSLESSKKVISELDALSERTGEVLEYFSSKEFETYLFQYLTKSNDPIELIYLEEDDIGIQDELEVETFGERINSPQANTVQALFVESVNHLSNTTYSLKISFDAKATLNYCAYYSGYMYLEEDTSRQVYVDSVNSDGLCDLSELFVFKFHGYVAIEFREDLDIDAIKAHSRYLGAEANPITAEIEIDMAEIVDV